MTIGEEEIDITESFIDNKYQYKMPEEDIEFSLFFTLLPVYNVNINAGIGGNIYRTFSTRKPYYGEEITFTVLADKDYEIVSFRVNQEEVELLENKTYSIIVEQEIDVEAEFKLINSSTNDVDENNDELIKEDKGCRSNDILLSITYIFGLLGFIFIRRIKV